MPDFCGASLRKACRAEGDRVSSRPMNSGDAGLRERIKEMIVQCARLKVPASSIGDAQSLFDPEKGLGLDSIDVLEIVVNVEKAFGVTIPDRETGRRVLESVDTLAEFIRASGAKK